MGRMIKLERYYEYPVHKLWYALTNKDAITKWFTESDLGANLDELPIGHKFTFVTLLEERAERN
jgi:uncharacterized protein YndB with AHSA1/START domain